MAPSASPPPPHPPDAPSAPASLSIERLAELPVYSKRSLALVRGKGCVVWGEDGRAYIDLTTGIGVALLGHGHKRLSAAIARSARGLMTASQSLSNPHRARLEARLSLLFDGLPQGEYGPERWGAGSAPPSNDSLSPSSSKVFLCNSGTEAMEAAVKLARAHTGRTGFVALEHGFHGRTMGALSLTHKEKYRARFQPLPGPVQFIPPERAALEAAVGPTTAAVVLEVVQGEGGVRPVPAEFIQAARAVCDRHGALLIIDEIQTGCGRTGTFFAFEGTGVRPDIVTLAKGLAGGVPIGAMVCRSSVASSLHVADHGSTFGGNPLAAAAANAVLDEIFSQNLLEKAREDGAWLSAELGRMKRTHPTIRAVRAHGLLVGIELSTPSSKDVMMRAQADGLLVLQAGDDVVRLMPPLNVPRSALKKALRTLGRALG